ncbi:hypothetical protein [Lichenihabitans psoromatis]|uniref:hypothetical protein n=1 Tax=Lichenihabitans psoromatis TaxID=2528642 RepID=UPI001036ADEB|nr:hypothetical protein [Lichenihabitans psoromatis]
MAIVDAGLFIALQQAGASSERCEEAAHEVAQLRMDVDALNRRIVGNGDNNFMGWLRRLGPTLAIALIAESVILMAAFIVISKGVR